jgi:hypothetical protein
MTIYFKIYNRFSEEEKKILLAWMPITAYIKKSENKEKISWKEIATQFADRIGDDIRCKYKMNNY